VIVVESCTGLAARQVTSCAWTLAAAPATIKPMAMMFERIPLHPPFDRDPRQGELITPDRRRFQHDYSFRRILLPLNSRLFGVGVADKKHSWRIRCNRAKRKTLSC
jgi:hypothetical protein